MKTLFVKLLSMLFVISFYEDIDEIVDKLAGIETDTLEQEIEGILPRIYDNDLKQRLLSVKRRIHNSKRTALLNSVLTRDHKYLLAKYNQLTPSARQEIQNGRAKFVDNILYHTVIEPTTISSIYDIIKPDSSLGAGFSNFDKAGQVPTGVNIVVDFIKVVWNMHSSGNPFSASFASTNTKPELAACDFEMLINGERVVQMPLMAFTEARAIKGSTPDNMKAGVNLKQLILLKEGDKIQFRLIAPDGVAITPDKDKAIAIRVMVYGLGTQPK